MYKDKAKQREYQRAWIAKRRADWFAVNGPCNWCGSRDSLQLDHIDPRAKVTHLVWSWSPSRAALELAKCQALCGPCHKLKTQRSYPEKHGSQRLYNLGCKCPECIEGRRVRNASRYK